MYQEIGEVLAKYRSGKVPKAFKFFPIHGSIQVLVSRFHKGLQDHPMLGGCWLVVQTLKEMFTLEMC